MHKWKLFTTSLTLVGLLLLSLSPNVKADVNDFTVNDFSADYSLSNDQKHGRMKVIETINLTYTDNNHGIFRAIPNEYKNRSLDIHDISVSSPTGAPSQFSSSTQNKNTVLKIGDPNKTVTGNQTYVVRYTVDNVISFYDEYDELYWDINGDQWQQPFTRVSAKLRLANGLSFSEMDPICFTGAFGGKGQSCESLSINSRERIFKTTAPLSSGKTLTITAAFKKGYFQPVSQVDKAREIAPVVAAIIVLPLTAFIISFRRWVKYGRDDRGKGIIIPQYDVPNGLKPIEVGSIIDFKADNKDVSATLIDLAVRKYITIIEKRNDKLIGKDELSYTLKLMSNDLTGLTLVESALLSGIFSQLILGEEVDLKSQANKLYAIAEKARTDTDDELKNAGYFKKNSFNVSFKQMFVAFGILIVIFSVESVFVPFFIMSAFIAITIFVGFAFIMPARTSKGVNALEHIKGLKLFLQVTEAERLKKLQGPNAAYAQGGQEPSKNIDLFEKLLPYAMVMGVEKEWAVQFSDLYAQSPSWYQGNANAFTAGYLISNLSSGFNTSVETAFASPSSSSGSGFSSGGGSSGGGGGGGGGGGW